ncbi:hypothetical protein ABGB14_11535 [Nonomuraea sp. B10E15]|uniref:hypothetical protein n=1 Tax=Nonomuraea sp. B10E15 TaxID=3153560 RepID=UPI00325D0935
MLILIVSSVVSVVIVVTSTTGTAGETSGASSRQGIRLARAADPVSTPTPGTLQAPVVPVSPSPSSPVESHPAASPHSSPTWTGKPGGEIYYGTFSKDECRKRGEEGLAAQKWSAYSCKELLKRDEPPKPGELIEDLEVVAGLTTGDHRLWVVDWQCMIKMEDNCG